MQDVSVNVAAKPDVEKDYMTSLRKKRFVTLVLLFAGLVAAFSSLFMNTLSTLTPDEVINVLVAHLTGNTVENEIFDAIVWEDNVPRAILGVLVGSSLAVGGAIMQSIMRNPLATPYTTGVSAGAGLGASLFVYLDIALIWTGEYYSSIAINAIAFALLPTIAILIVSQQKHITPTTMILAGVAMMYVFSAITSLLMLISDPNNVKEAYEWGIGSLARADWSNVMYVTAIVVPTMIILQILAGQVHMMNAGNRSATSMGVSVRAIRNLSLIVVAVMTAITVGITGGIGFMGLVAPHIARILVGSNLKYMLPCSAALGVLIMMVADNAARMLSVPVGVITALIGGPLFVILLIKGAKKVWF